MVNVDLFVPFLQRQTRCPVRVVVVAASAVRICLPPHSLAAPYAVVSSPHQARVVPTDRSPYGACATAPLCAYGLFRVADLRSWISGSTPGFADRGSLVQAGVPPLAHRSRQDGPVSSRGSFWQVAGRAYALPDIRLLSGDPATRPEASPYRTPLPERSKLGSGGSLIRGSPLHLLLPMWATRPAAPYRTPLLEGSKRGSDGSLVRGSVAPRLLPMRTRPRDQQGQRR